MHRVDNSIKLHFIGIGGIGMSGIAEVLLSLGYKVSGSDLSESVNVKRLKEKGAEVFLGHKIENAKDASVIVYSSAVKEDNPEMRYARDNEIPVMRRAEMLAELMRLKHGIAIGGTHGKTTTTSFLATILEESEYDPTYIIGGIVKNLDGHAKVGKGDYLVAEADESDGSFLLSSPIMSAVTNIDNDHLDHYGSEEKLIESFEKFVNKVPFYGLVALNAHDERLMEIKSRIKKPYLTFGLGDEIKTGLDVEARNLMIKDNESKFELYFQNEKKADVIIHLPGKHNVLNALGAITLAQNMGVSFELISKSISAFKGVGRRFQTLYKDKDIEIIDDYGHHPTEIAATLKTLKETRSCKTIAVFEPHRYTRTRDCWNEFLHCFNHVDELYIGPIYPASEKPIPGIDSERLVSDINQLHPGFAHHLSSYDQLDEIIEKNKGASVATLGAGSIGRVIREWVLDYESKK